MMMQLDLTPQLRAYGLRELIRRSGVSAEAFARFKIISAADATELVLPNGATVRFPHISHAFVQQLCRGIPAALSIKALDADLAAVQGAAPSRVIVPFTECAVGPLFRLESAGRAVCAVDLPVSVTLILSRFEEVISSARDEHGRFPVQTSIAVRDGFLDRPIVDEYGLVFERVLAALMPGWQPQQRRLQAMISHDIDHVGFPDNHRRIARHVVHDRNVMAGLHDMVSAFTRLLPRELLNVKRLADLARSIKLQSKVYFMASPRTRFDSGYDIRNPKIGELARWLRDQGVEIGFHPGYYTLHEQDRLRAECDVFRGVFGNFAFGGRQHYLRWHPDSWRHWERCGIAYDSSVGYTALPGFRAGTCFSYRPWLLTEHRVSKLLEVPLILMDITLLRVMKLRPQAMLDTAVRFLERCREVGGVFSLLWHNTNLTSARDRWLFRSLIQQLDGSVQFDWSRSLETDW